MNILIITGGTLQIEFAREYLKNHKFDQVITADAGLAYAKKLDVPVDWIMGDFDTLSPMVLKEYKQKNIPIETYSPQKDYTDTHLALENAIEMGAKHITIMCATGTRLDHTFANIGLMMMAMEKGIDCEIVDANNRIRMIKDKLILHKKSQWGKYISLIPYTEKVSGITLTGFAYPLTEATLTIGISRGISNELKEETGTITIREGCLLVIESLD